MYATITEYRCINTHTWTCHLSRPWQTDWVWKEIPVPSSQNSPSAFQIATTGSAMNCTTAAVLVIGLEVVLAHLHTTCWGGRGGWLEGGLGGLLYQMVKRPSWTRADSVWATPTGTYHAINIQWMTVKYISTKQCFLNIEDNRVHFTFTIQSVLYYVVFVISADSCTVSCVMCCANV